MGKLALAPYVARPPSTHTDPLTVSAMKRGCDQAPKMRFRVAETRNEAIPRTRGIGFGGLRYRNSTSHRAAFPVVGRGAWMRQGSVMQSRL
jgi:hypothetical protein